LGFFRKRHATVLAALALTISLGGNAAAAIIISSNGQVAANTISGHQPPSGDHANLIAGSIGSTDLHAGAVAATNIAAGAVTRTKLGFPTFTVTQPKTDNTERTLVSTDGLKLTYKCSADFGDPQLTVFISASQSGAYATGEVNDIDNSTTTQVHTTIPSSDQSLTAAGSDAATSHTIVTLTYQAATHVGLVTLDATTNNLTSMCTVQGAFVALT
jgi:hypothetical protein